MLINADAEGMKAIESLFDVALKAGGMANFSHVVKIMDSVEEIKPKGKQKKKVEKKPSKKVEDE